jgi:hypothetical protein
VVDHFRRAIHSEKVCPLRPGQVIKLGGYPKQQDTRRSSSITEPLQNGVKAEIDILGRWAQGGANATPIHRNVRPLANAFAFSLSTASIYRCQASYCKRWRLHPFNSWYFSDKTKAMKKPRADTTVISS